MAIGVRSLEGDAQYDGVARILLMHDGDGKVLVLLPWEGLLNLEAIWKGSGRQLQPARSDDARRFFSQPGLNQDAGLRKLLSLPLYIDLSLQSRPDLHVYEPHSDRTFVVQGHWLSEDHIQAHPLALTRADIDAGQPGGDDRAVITRAVEKFTALRIRQRLEDTLGLPSLSPTMQKILMMRCDPEAGVDSLVPVVRLDPSLSAQVMSWASSSYYAAPGKVHSLEDAIIRVLGFDLVVNLALGVALGKTLQIPHDTPRGATDYWQQAVYTATLAEGLCRKMSMAERLRPGLAYLAGLLHNFGYLVLAHLFPPHFSLLSRYIEANPHISTEYIEKQVLNVTREQVGSWLLESWSVPAEVCVAVRRQNDTDYDGEYCGYAQLVHLSNRLLREQGLSDGPIETIPAGLTESLGLSRTQISEAMQYVLDSKSRLGEVTEAFITHGRHAG
ncbi:HDOD domain-containing protein [Marinobacterium rhizophilum]|uniref:HDOD domain-containing protein n=1 Tax=Marinobacterium rhizophilum TaxID=420402 RepID=UPI00036781FE|nr:HDOD domain-containing protein [Marinobacterium rhizophilum]